MNEITRYLLSECEETIHGNLCIAQWKLEDYAYIVVGSDPRDYIKVHAFKGDLVKHATSLGLWVLN